MSEPKANASVKEGLIALSGLLAEQAVTRLEMTVIEPDGTRGVLRALLPRFTDLPGTLGTALARRVMVDLFVPQMDLTLRLWTDAGTLHGACDPADHPMGIGLKSLGLA